MANWELAGEAGVDSGTVLIGDPCYAIREPLWEQFCLWAEMEELAERGAVELPYATGRGQGVVLSRFGGDGSYPVFVQRDSDGAVVAAQVRFDGEEPR